MERDSLKQVERVQAVVAEVSDIEANEPSRAVRMIVRVVRRLFELSPVLAGLIVCAVADEARAQNFDPNDGKPAGISGVVLDDEMEAVEEDPYADEKEGDSDDPFVGDPDDPFSDKDPFDDGGDDPFGLPKKDPFGAEKPAPKPTPSPEPEPTPEPQPEAKVKPTPQPEAKPVPVPKIVPQGGETRVLPKVAPNNGIHRGDSALTDADVDRLYDGVAPSTIRLYTKFRHKSTGDIKTYTCSGWMIEDGVVATARHCIASRGAVNDNHRDEELVSVSAEWPSTFDPETGEISKLFVTNAEPVGFSNSADSAFVVLPVNVKGPKPLATNGKVRKGHSVAYLGHPRGMAWVLTTARVSEVISEGTGRLAFSKEAMRGNSGGPAVNKKGEVIGTMVYGDDKFNMGFAVPIAATRELLAAVKQRGWVENARNRVGAVKVLECDSVVSFHDFTAEGGDVGKSGQTVQAVSNLCRVAVGQTLSTDRLEDEIRRLLGLDR